MEENKFKLELTEAEVNTVLFALGERPLKDVFELVVKIKTQASRQIQAKKMMDEQFKNVVAQNSAVVPGMIEDSKMVESAKNSVKRTKK